MNYSDEQLQDESQHGDSSIKADVESSTMPKIVPVPAPKKPAEPPEEQSTVGQSFADELVSVMFKTVFVALSLLAMLACIIAVALPLNSMRIFNSLGMSARAVDFGERYIARELNSYSDDRGRTADYTDSNGNYTVLSATPALTKDDFIEALYVCNRLSDKLMTESLKSGDTESARYYAERLEKYTRIYLSLYGLSGVSLKTDAKNINDIGVAALHPVVYSYEHDMRVQNYKARAVLGTTDGITYNNRSDNMGVMTTLSERARRFYGSMSETPAGRAQLLDEFVDYVDQLGAYLDVEFMKIGVETDLGKKYTVTEGSNTISGSVLSETILRILYGNRVLDGDEFSLFIMPLKDVTETTNGFTLLYSQLSCFTQYAQWAVDTVPNEDNGELHQLYWLRVLSSVAQKLWYMEMLLYHNSMVLGQNSEAVTKNYGTCEKYMYVEYDLMSGYKLSQLSEVYAQKLTQYVAK